MLRIFQQVRTTCSRPHLPPRCPRVVPTTSISIHRPRVCCYAAPKKYEYQRTVQSSPVQYTVLYWTGLD